MRLTRSIPLVAAALTTIAAGPRQAAAAGVDAVCVGSFSASFNPPVTNTPHDVTITLQLNLECELGASSASSTTVIHAHNLQCDGNILTPGSPFTQIVSWTGGTGPSTSDIRVTSFTGPNSTFLGEVEDGRFLGATAQEEFTGLSFGGTNPLLCGLGLGNVTLINGLATLTLEQL